MKITPLGCTIFAIFGQVITNMVSFIYFTAWIYWITNGYVANIQRTHIHLGLNVFALIFIVYSFLMGCHICYVIHHDFDNIRAYFWTRIHLFMLIVAFSLLSLIELSMYLEISNIHLNQILLEIVDTTAKTDNSTSMLNFPRWMRNWQSTHKCCGIRSYKDYIEYGDGKSVSSDCCRWKTNFAEDNGWKCGDGVLRMAYVVMEEKIYTKGCGPGIQNSLKSMSLFSCILASITTVFVVTSSFYYLSFLKEYSQEQHVNRMRRYDNEEREQLKLLSKKRHQQQLLQNSGNKGPVKAHGTKVSSTSQQSRSRSRSRSKSNKKTHTSSDLDKTEYHREEKSYIKNSDDKSDPKISIKSKSSRSLAKSLEKSNQNVKVKRESRETSSTRSRSCSKESRTKSRNASPRPAKKPAEEYPTDCDLTDKDREECQDFPSFVSNENLFINLIGVASSRRLHKNPSNTSSIDFQDDVLVPRVLLTQAKKSKQVLFDQNVNVYYDKENDLTEDHSLDFHNDKANHNIPKHTIAKINFTDEEDDDPGDIIVRQLQ